LVNISRFCRRLLVPYPLVAGGPASRKGLIYETHWTDPLSTNAFGKK